jgi:hypothetical protein
MGVAHGMQRENQKRRVLCVVVRLLLPWSVVLALGTWPPVPLLMLDFPARRRVSGAESPKDAAFAKHALYRKASKPSYVGEPYEPEFYIEETGLVPWLVNDLSKALNKVS